MSYYVYAHYRLDKEIPFYIGKGTKGRAWSKHSRNTYWHRIVSKHGYDVRLIANGLDNELCCLAEIEAISKYKDLGFSLANMTNGGEGSHGRKMSDKTKEKIGKANSGKNPNISKSKVGTKLSDDHRQNIKKAMNKDHVIEANRQRGLKLLFGKNPNSKKIMCIETGKIFDSLSSAALWLGINKTSGISTGLSTGRTRYGYHWCYHE